jgi:hypothetical protein
VEQVILLQQVHLKEIQEVTKLQVQQRQPMQQVAEVELVLLVQMVQDQVAVVMAEQVYLQPYQAQM